MDGLSRGNRSGVVDGTLATVVELGVVDVEVEEGESLVTLDASVVVGVLDGDVVMVVVDGVACGGSKHT